MGRGSSYKLVVLGPLASFGQAHQGRQWGNGGRGAGQVAGASAVPQAEPAVLSNVNAGRTPR